MTPEEVREIVRELFAEHEQRAFWRRHDAIEGAIDEFQRFMTPVIIAVVVGFVALLLAQYAFAADLPATFNLAPGQSVEIVIPGPATATPRPTRTPAPFATCPPEFPMPCEAFGCCAKPLVPTPRPSATPRPTEPAPITDSPFALAGLWFCGGETSCARMQADVAWAVNCHVDVAFWEKYHRPLAKRVAWHGYLNTSWMDPPEMQMEAARQKSLDLWGCMQQRKRQILEQAPGALAPPMPELVSLETGTFGWASAMWGTGGGFFRPDGVMRPVSKWPRAIDDPHRKLWKEWREMGGGTITSTPYEVTWAITLPEAWHVFARTNEPALFSALPWRPYSAELDGVDFPDLRAFKVAIAAFERWVQKFRAECIELGLPCGLVAQLTNGSYQRQPGGGGVWQRRMVQQLPALLAKYGFEPAVQQELFDGVQARPAFDCVLWTDLKNAGAKVSAFDGQKAVATHEVAMECAGGGEG